MDRLPLGKLSSPNRLFAIASTFCLTPFWRPRSMKATFNAPLTQLLTPIHDRLRTEPFSMERRRAIHTG